MLMDVNIPTMNTVKKEMAYVKTFQMEMIVKKIYLWWKFLFLGLTVLDMAKESNSQLEHTAITIEDIRVKKKYSEKP